MIAQVQMTYCICLPIEIQSKGAGDRATLVKLLVRLHQTFVIEQEQKWLTAVGDAKIHNVILSIREDYVDHVLQLGSPLPWGLAHPMKACVDAGHCAPWKIWWLQIRNSHIPSY